MIFMRDFEALPHTADLKIRVYGASLSQLFEHAVIGMFQSIEPVTPLCSIKNDRLVCKNFNTERSVTLTSPDIELLLIDFLSEALYFSDIYNEAYLKAVIHHIDERSVKATLYGVSVKRFGIEIKAVTYHDLKIIKTDDGYQVDIVFDI